jgi:hypothetical protein
MRRRSSWDVARSAYDRWRTFGNGASLTLSADGTTITLNGTAGQIIELANAANATVTVSATNPSGPITVNLRPDATTAGVTGQIPAGAGLQSVTLAVPATLTGNLFMLLSTAGSVTIDGPAKKGGFQFEFGSFASAFETSLPVDER